MANSQKVVDVPDIGVVAFPGDMEDTHVANYIKIARAKKKFSPLQTEESEHARQLKPAQPLDSAIPTLPKWANTPLAPILDKKVDYVDRALWPGGTANWDKLTAESEADKQRFMGKHPIAGGVFEGVNETAEGLTSPANLALMIAAPESKIMSGLFAIQALHGSYKDIEEARKAYREGRNAEASKYATQAVLNLGIAGLAGHHAVKDIPVPEPVKDFARSEEGSVGSQEKVQNPEAENKTVKMLTDGKAGGYRLDHLLKNHPDVTITSVGTESLNPATLKRIQGWTRESKLDDWKNTNANVKDMPPVEVVRTPHGDYLYDGTHRTEFATRQGEKVPATVYTIKTKGDAVTPVAPKIADVKAKAAELQPTTAYKSADQSQPFYLKSENLVSEKMKGPMPAEDVHKMLLSNGVKPEEMKWTGLDELLQGKGKQKVTPQEIQEHLAGNNLQVQEVTKGGFKNWSQEDSARLDELERNRNNLTDEEEAEFQRLVNRENENSERGTGRPPEITKFGSYVLPGAEPGSYRELLVTLPPKKPLSVFRSEGKYYLSNTDGSVYTKPNGERASFDTGDEAGGYARNLANTNGKFQSSHWDEPNVLGHVRFNDRTGPNGEKILHVEELQSDWAQSGRKKGFQGEAPNTTGWKATKTEDHPESWTITDNQGHEISEGGRNLFYGKTQAEAIADAAHTVQTGAGRTSKVPPMPFSKTWPELLLKRMMKYASDNNYSGISWTPGEEQASRYDLSKQIDHIDYRKTPDGKYSLAPVDKNGEGVDLPKESFTAEELPDVIGKEVAQKIVNGEGKPGGGRMTLSNLDLKIGGSGMKGFYDKIIPDAANKLGKQWGAKVGEKKASVGTLSRNDIHSYQGPELTQPEISQIYKDIKEGRRNNTSLAEGTNFVNRSYLDQTLMQIASEMGKGRSYEEAVDSVLANNRTLLDNYAKEMGGKVAQKKYQFKKVPYLPITPQMRAGVKSIPYSLFSIPLAAGALSLAQVKAKAEELKKRSGVQ